MHHPTCGGHIVLLIVTKGEGDPSEADKKGKKAKVWKCCGQIFSDGAGVMRPAYCVIDEQRKSLNDGS
jgi:hypothetical protein